MGSSGEKHIETNYVAIFSRLTNHIFSYFIATQYSLPRPPFPPLRQGATLDTATPSKPLTPTTSPEDANHICLNPGASMDRHKTEAEVEAEDRI
jgi:hypothetical protein